MERPNLCAFWMCCILAMQAASAAEAPLKLTHDVLVGAKLQLCPGLIDSNVRYYLETHMVKQYKEYQRSSEFGDARRKEIFQEVRDKLATDAAHRFSRDKIYSIRDIEGELSLYDRAASGFREMLPASIWFYHTDEDERFAGARNLADDQRAVDATYTMARPGRGFLGYPEHYTVETVVNKPIISLRLSLSPKDSLALNVLPGHSDIFIPMSMQQGERIAGYYGWTDERRTFGDVEVKIVECMRHPRTGFSNLVAEIVGFQYFAAHMERKFWEPQATWKRKELLISWHRPE